MLFCDNKNKSYEIQSASRLSNIHINTIDNKYINLCQFAIKNSFYSMEDMIGFLEEMGGMKYSLAIKYVQII